MLATGVLLFLLYDVISKANEPIGAALDQVRTHQSERGTFALDVFLLIIGVGLGSVGLVYFNTAVFGRRWVRKAIPASVADAGSSLHLASTQMAAGELP